MPGLQDRRTPQSRRCGCDILCPDSAGPGSCRSDLRPDRLQADDKMRDRAWACFVGSLGSWREGAKNDFHMALGRPLLLTANLLCAAAHRLGIFRMLKEKIDL